MVLRSIRQIVFNTQHCDWTFAFKLAKGKDEDVELGFGVKIFPVKAAMLATIVVNNTITVNFMLDSAIWWAKIETAN